MTEQKTYWVIKHNDSYFLCKNDETGVITFTKDINLAVSFLREYAEPSIENLKILRPSNLFELVEITRTTKEI